VGDAIHEVMIVYCSHQDMPRVPSQSQLSVSDKSSLESRSRSNSDLMTGPYRHLFD
jgi:hypothetical protein